MTRPLDPLRAALAVAAALGVGLTLGLGLVLALGAAPVQAATVPASTGPVVDRAVFTGTFVGRPTTSGAGAVRRFAYQVDVERVYTDTVVETERVMVLSRVALETCPPLDGGRGGAGQGGAGQGGVGQGGSGQGGAGRGDQDRRGDGSAGGTGGGLGQAAGRAAGRAGVEDRLWVFDTAVADTGYRIDGCAAVTPASSAALALLTRRFGKGTLPGVRTPAPDPLDAIAYLCPDTREALPDLDATGECRALADDPPSVDRALAPGAALVLVGLLGLVVTRRLGRR